jgi:hypothetical protein
VSWQKRFEPQAAGERELYGRSRSPPDLTKVCDFRYCTVTAVATARKMVEQTRAMKEYRGQPLSTRTIISIYKPETSVAAVAHRAVVVLGLPMKNGFDEGYQSVPVNGLSLSGSAGFSNCWRR